MRIGLLRALFTLTTLAVVWLVARPASAAGAITQAPMMSLLHPVAEADPAEAPPSPAFGAPLCDPRGATTFAPPPQMQDVEVSLDSGLTLDDCVSTSTSTANGTHRAAPGRAPLPSDAGSSSDAAVLTAVAMLGRLRAELLPAPVPSTTCSRPGIRSTVDRPPRA